MSATAQDHAGWGDIDPEPGMEALTTAHAEGRARAEAGDLTGARTLLEDALSAGELRLGRDHPRLAPLMVDLATIARNVGNLTEAQIQLRRAYSIVVASTGPEHPTALSIEGRLAAICYRLGEPTEAYDWHIAEAGAKILGPEHPAVRGAQQRLAEAPAEPGYSPYDPGGWAPPGPLEPDYEGDPADGYPEPHDAARPGAYPTAYESTPYETPNPYDTPGPDPEPYEIAQPGVYQRRDLAVPAPRQRATQPTAEEWPDEQTTAADYFVQRREPGHAAGIAVVMTVGLAIIAGAVVVAVQLFGPSARPVTTSTNPAIGPSAVTTPTVEATAPTRVTVADKGGSVTLTWVDPSEGTVPFIVSGGRVGTTPSPLESIVPGKTTVTIYGLNEKFDYCFTVAAVWSSEQIDPSERVCTQRLSTGGEPSVPITGSTA